MVVSQGRAVAKHVQSSSVQILSKLINGGIDGPAMIYSDTYGSYKHLTKTSYILLTNNHCQQE